MRIALVLFLSAASAVASAQSDIWKQVNAAPDAPQLSSAQLTPAQLKSIQTLFKHTGQFSAWSCSPDAAKELFDGLTYEDIPLSPGHKVLLVEAGTGCARGGQGANGAMWLIRLDGGIPALLAAPGDEFGGWIYSIQPTVKSGYRDIVLGWHMSGAETALSYFRFNGKSYRCIGRASAKADQQDDKWTITPAPK